MSNQIVISSGAKVRELEGVLTGTSGIVSSVPLGGANGVATLDSGGKVPVSQLPASVVTYLGTWNAATNTPTLANGTGDAGDMYICNVAGTVNFGAGPITFAVGDWVLYGSGTWQKSNGQNGTVTSVAASITGDSIGITGSPITTAGTLAFAFAGTGAQYIKGDGTLATFPTTIAQANRLVTEVYNSTGATLTKGTVVYINGGQGNLPTVTKAIATGDSTSAQTYGVVQSDITNNNNGYVVVIGSLTDLDTQAYAVGTQLYLSSTTAGAWTSTKQYAPAHLVYVAIVVRSHPTQGVVEVRIQNGFELDELHNVSAQTPSNNDGIFYNSTTSLWESKSIAAALGYTPANDASVVHLTGNETIGGTKTFSDATKNNGGILLQNGSSSTLAGYMNLGGLTNGVKFTSGGGISNTFTLPSATGYTFTFPNATGTVALTSDISYPVTSVFGRTGAVVAAEGDYSLTQLSDVIITSPTNGQVLKYNGTSWVNGTDTDTGITSLNGLTALAQTFAVGTSGTDFNISSATSTHTFNLPTASATNRGALSSADWSTFNGKQAALSGTGFVKISGTTISYDNSTYLTTSSASSTYLPLAGGTLTGALNGTSAVFSGSVTSYGALYVGQTGVTNGIINSNDGMYFNIDADASGSTPEFMFGKGRSTAGGGGTTLFTIANSGAATFSSSVQVNGAATSTPLGVKTATNQNWRLLDNSGAQFDCVNDALNARVDFRIQGDSYFFGSGNVGLGQSSDAGYKLDVNGTGRFSGNVYANTGTGANFRAVFDSNNILEVSNYSATSGYQGLNIIGSPIKFYTATAGAGSASLALTLASTGAATFSSSVTATSFFESSDSRLKTLIQDNYQTKGIAAITPKLYTKNGKVELGYYAQDFIGILDSAVSKGDDDMLSLSYREVHTAKIYALEQRIKELESKLN